MMNRIDWRWLWGATAVILLAAFLRFHQLGAQSFWNDEGNSARLSERSLRLILEGTASDVHPPLYYLALRGWREFAGDSEFGLRALSAFAGLLLVAGVMALARQLDPQCLSDPLSFGLLAGLLAAVSPPLVYYSQEARMYQLLGLTAVLSTWFLLLWLRRGGRPLALAYLLCLTAGLYTHYFFPVVLVLHGVVALLASIGEASVGSATVGDRPLGLSKGVTFMPDTFGRLRRQLLSWLLLVVGAWLLYLPWLPVFLHTMGGAGRDSIRGAMTQFAADSGRWLLLGETASRGEVSWLWWVAAAILAGAIVAPAARAVAYRPAPRLSFAKDAELLLILAAGLLIPLGLMFAGGLARPAYLKFLLVAAPFVSLLLATGLIGWRRMALPVAWGLLLALLVGQAVSLDNLYRNPAYARADYRGMAARIAADNHPNAGVILNAPNQWEVFTYYHREGAPVYPLPEGWPDAAQIAAQLEAITARHQRLYAIFWGEAERDPERLVERWLDAHAFKATDEWVGDVRFVIYAVPEEPAREMATAANLAFGPQITLLGYTTNVADVQPGDILQVTLFWQTAVPLTDRYKVFLHLLDEQGHIVAQRDSEPGGGLALTTVWVPGDTVVDNHGILLPLGMADGRYSLRLGLYELTDPSRRLPITTPSGVVDAVEIAVYQLPR
jgi:mannosyltransferase